jgi:formiminoglutamase
MTPVEVMRGDGPVVLGMPHTGTHVPPDILARLNDLGRTLSDTDWHIDRLYNELLPGVTVVRATFHRYVIDANRPPDGESLYPGQNTTGLCPVTDFDGRDIYRMGESPGTDEIEDRRAHFHAPYHAALAAEVDRVRARHGTAVLYDCHSIRSQIPFLFEGTLPDFNIGTNEGQSCAPQLEAAVTRLCGEAEGYTSVLNGRFKGGWTTRHYGRPNAGVHAIQMELAQSTHLATEALPFAYEAGKAARLRPHLRTVLETLADLALSLKGTP